MGRIFSNVFLQIVYILQKFENYEEKVKIYLKIKNKCFYFQLGILAKQSFNSEAQVATVPINQVRNRMERVSGRASRCIRPAENTNMVPQRSGFSKTVEFGNSRLMGWALLWLIVSTWGAVLPLNRTSTTPQGVDVNSLECIASNWGENFQTAYFRSFFRTLSGTVSIFKHSCSFDV